MFVDQVTHNVLILEVVLFIPVKVVLIMLQQTFVIIILIQQSK